MSELFQSAEVRKLLARIRMEAKCGLATHRTPRACKLIVNFIDNEARRYALEVLAECDKSAPSGGNVELREDSSYDG